MISRLYDLLKTVWALYSDEQAKQVYNKKASWKYHVWLNMEIWQEIIKTSRVM